MTMALGADSTTWRKRSSLLRKAAATSFSSRGVAGVTSGRPSKVDIRWAPIGASQDCFACAYTTPAEASATVALGNAVGYHIGIFSLSSQGFGSSTDELSGYTAESTPQGRRIGLKPVL